MSDFDRFCEAYQACAVWATAQGSLEGYPIHENTLAAMEQDCQDFVLANYRDLAAHGTPEQGGHDFWLSRNRHGTGFWDRGTGEVGDRLYEAAKLYGTVDVYLGDDNYVYA